MSKIPRRFSIFSRSALFAFIIAVAFAAPRAQGREPLSDRSVWSEFLKTEIRAGYSVNTIYGAHVGALPFTIIVGSLALLLTLLTAFRSNRSFPDRLPRAAATWFAAGALLFAARSTLDQVRTVSTDDQFLRGRPMSEKHAMLNPRGFYPLLAEGIRRIPYRATVELRAEKPFPWEKGGYYLYPHRVVEGADWIISYRTAAPGDSTSYELIFRRDGAGSIYRRETR